MTAGTERRNGANRLEKDGEEEKQQGRAVGVSRPSLKFRSLIYFQRAGTALQLVMWN